MVLLGSCGFDLECSMVVCVVKGYPGWVEGTVVTVQDSSVLVGCALRSILVVG